MGSALQVQGGTRVKGAYIETVLAQAGVGTKIGQPTSQMLRSKISSVSYLGDIAIYDADGELISWSRAQPLPKINVSSRGYFQAFKTNPQSEPVILESVRSFIIGKWTTVVARRLNSADGSFLGAMVRRIDPDSYHKYFASVALAEGTAISLFDREGKMLARYPHVEELIGRNFKDGPLMQKVLAEGGQHTLRGNSPVNGEQHRTDPLFHHPPDQPSES